MPQSLSRLIRPRHRLKIARGRGDGGGDREGLPGRSFGLRGGPANPLSGRQVGKLFHPVPSCRPCLLSYSSIAASHSARSSSRIKSWFCSVTSNPASGRATAPRLPPERLPHLSLGKLATLSLLRPTGAALPFSRTGGGGSGKNQIGR